MSHRSTSLVLAVLLGVAVPAVTAATAAPAAADQSGPCALTPDAAVGPLDKDYYLPKRTALEAVVLFVDYAGARAADSELAGVERDVLQDADARMRDLTYGNVTLHMTPVRKWFHMPGTAKSYNLGAVDDDQANKHLADALALADPEVDFSKANVVYLAAAPDTPDVPASQASVQYAGDGMTVDGKEIRASVNLSPGFGVDDLTVQHETLHLFGLPDLYAAGDDFDAWTGGYDLMGGAATQPEPFAWQRWQIGHLPDVRVACLAPGEARDLVLQPLTSDQDGLTTVVVRTGDHTRLVGEYRTRGGLDTKACSTGLLLYRVDDRIETGKGPIRVVDGRPSTACGGHPLNDAPLDVGHPTYTDPASGTRFDVVAVEDAGLRLRTSQGQVAPAPGLTIAPAVVSAGQAVTATWTGQPGQVVEVLSRTQPATEFSVIRTITLDGNGRATTTHRPQRNTRLTGRTAGTTVLGAQPLIQVKSVASMRVLAGDAAGTQVVTGKVYPARPGRIVNVYRNGRLAAQARNDAAGVYRIGTRFPAGDATIEVRTGDDTYNLGASIVEAYTIG